MQIRRIGFALLLSAVACDEAPVSLPEPAGVTVAAATMALAVGDVAPVAAQVVDQDGQVMQGQAVVYSTDNASVATVGTDGMVRAVAPGTANVTAANGGSSASVRVTVTPDRRAELQAFDVLADSVVADRRAGVQVVAVRATNGLGQTICPVLTLRSSDASVVTARVGGACSIEVVPWFAGEATITAEAEGRSDTFRVRVTSSGQIAFFSARPTAEQLVAGATVSYAVKVLDHTNAPIANRRVHFETSVGTLSATSTTTDENGTATVQWQIPTHLQAWGQNHWIAFRAPLPNGTVAGRTENVFINGASLVEMVLYYGSPGAFIRLNTASITALGYNYAYVGASGVDEYGNTRVVDFTFSVTNYWGWSCGGPAGSRDSYGIEYTCFYLPTGGTSTLTATAATGESKSVQVAFVSN